MKPEEIKIIMAQPDYSVYKDLGYAGIKFVQYSTPEGTTDYMGVYPVGTIMIGSNGIFIEKSIEGEWLRVGVNKHKEVDWVDFFPAVLVGTHQYREIRWSHCQSCNTVIHSTELYCNHPRCCVES